MNGKLFQETFLRIASAAFHMTGQPHGFLFGMGPVHAVISARRDQHMISRREIETLPGSFKKKSGTSAQHEHPFCSLRTEPLSFRCHLPEGDDPLNLKTLALGEGLKHFPLFGRGKS